MMEYTQPQHTTKQHTTPKCYLKNFSEDRTKIFQKSKTVHIDNETVAKELNKAISIKKKATVVADFYTVKSGREPMLIETLIYDRGIENHYPRIYKLLINPEVQGFNIEERTQLLMCLLSLHCRTPKQFRLFFEFVKPMVNDPVEMEKIREDYKAVHVKRYTS